VSYYFLTKEGKRPKLARPAPPGLVPAPLPEDWQEGDALPDPALDDRPDEERVLDGYEGYAVAFALDREPTELERIDLDLQAIVPDLEAARAARKAQVEARMADAFAAGFAIDEGGLAGQVLQLRDDTDRTNWLASAHVYGAMVAAGHGDLEQAAFRTAANETITVTFAEGHQVLLGMQAWGAAIMGCSWRLKDALAAAADAEAIMGIDIEAEAWPS
jgi:hypothetical protein